MTFLDFFFFLVSLVIVKIDASVLVKRDNGNTNFTAGVNFEKKFFGEERNLEQEIFQELTHLSVRKQREIFDDLEKQREGLDESQKSFVLSEPENLSPLNVEELKKIKNTIKTSSNSLPAIRNKRTLNFLLAMVARAMGYTLTPTNPDAEWIPRQRPQQPPSAAPPPCPTTPPPCRPNPPPAMPPPCSMPPSAPPCRGSTAMQPATVPPNQVDANTIAYPYRPARTIPLLNFAPLPQGIRVPYPPLLQPLASRAPCGAPPPPPCGSTPAPPPPPCAAPPPPPCGSTPAPPPPPCATPPPPPCGTTPAPSPPPCATTPAPKPLPCAMPAPSPPPCATTPAPMPPPCMTPAPKPQPCSTPAPPPMGCMTTPAPAPAPCGPPPPPPPPSEKPTTSKKGSILLEYDDPVRIQIFSNEKKFLPASDNIFKGHGDHFEEKVHSYFFPSREEIRRKDDDVDEEVQEEQIEAEEEEEDEGTLGKQQGDFGEFKQQEEEGESTQANNEEEDESETNLSIVKKPVDNHKKQRRRIISPKSSQKSESAEETTSAIKKPKRKKWVRIVKKQRRKTKTDSSPQDTFQVFSSDNLPASSLLSSRVFGEKAPKTALHSFERDFPDFDDSRGESNENSKEVELKKVIINDKELAAPEYARGGNPYEININPYVQESESERRKKLEKAVERYVEDYVEKQLGQELIKNTGLPKTTVFEYAPKNGPKIQTITTTVAKSTRTGKPANFQPQFRPETRLHYAASRPRQTGNSFPMRRNPQEENLQNRGHLHFEPFPFTY